MPDSYCWTFTVHFAIALNQSVLFSIARLAMTGFQSVTGQGTPCQTVSLICGGKQSYIGRDLQGLGNSLPPPPTEISKTNDTLVHSFDPCLHTNASGSSNMISCLWLREIEGDSEPWSEGGDAIGKQREGFRFVPFTPQPSFSFFSFVVVLCVFHIICIPTPFISPIPLNPPPALATSPPK